MCVQVCQRLRPVQALDDLASKSQALRSALGRGQMRECRQETSLAGDGRQGDELEQIARGLSPQNLQLSDARIFLELFDYHSLTISNTETKETECPSRHGQLSSPKPLRLRPR